MMFGTREKFEYGQCAGCGCVALSGRPADMARYYPADYCSFSAKPGEDVPHDDNVVSRYLRHRRTAFLINGKGLAGRIVSLAHPAQPLLTGYLSWMRNCHARFSSSILDVGCGTGRLLKELAWYGFTSLAGVDAFINVDKISGPGVKIRKGYINDVDGLFDCIMLHHSFEHMDDPLAVCRHIVRLLKKGGYALIRMPTVSSYAWQHYKENWVQLDAPRHIFLHSLESMKILAEKSGLIIRDIVFDSTDFQFWASEQYIRDIPLNDPRSYARDRGAGLFTEAQIKEFQQKAAQLNAQKQGDQVCVYLTRI
jgi:2-polyprenyl-3-methyl-5-hydroxy-6-metoxy-1,4-benzoquinol methylase